MRWDLEIPAWIGWVQLPAGLYILFLTLRGRLWRKKNHPSESDTDENGINAAGETDAACRHEHDEPPEDK